MSYDNIQMDNQSSVSTVQVVIKGIMDKCIL